MHGLFLNLVIYLTVIEHLQERSRARSIAQESQPRHWPLIQSNCYTLHKMYLVYIRHYHLS